MTSSKGHLTNPSQWHDPEKMRILVQRQVLSARENSDSHIFRVHPGHDGMHAGLPMCESCVSHGT